MEDRPRNRSDVPNTACTTILTTVIQSTVEIGYGPLNLAISGEIKGMIAIYKRINPTQVSSIDQERESEAQQEESRPSS